MAAAATAQEHGVAADGEPAEDRPVPHFGLGYEGGRNGGIDHEDVQPRDVIGHQQTARRRHVAGQFKTDSQNGKDVPRPVLLESEAAGRAGPGQEQGRGEQAARQMQCQAGVASGAEQAGSARFGFQSLRPMKCLA